MTAICEACYFTVREKCEKCIRNEVKQQMNKGEILVAIHDMRGEYAHEMNESLMKVGKNVIEGSLLAPLATPNLTKSYYQAQAKVSVLDELLEKIANTPDNTGEVKHNPFCNEVIRDAQGNEIARARGINNAK
jgi:hypothetical protein